MAVLVVAVATVVAILGMILFAVHKFRPRSLRLKATVARWLILSLEIEHPQRSNQGLGGRSRHEADPSPGGTSNISETPR